jgi:hypothetical protein
MGNKLHDDAAGVLETASNLVTGDRARAHGDAHDQHATAAALWSTYLRSRGKLLADIEPYELAMLMALLKISRDALGQMNRDTFVDLAGYAALAYAVRQRQGDGGEKAAPDVS